MNQLSTLGKVISHPLRPRLLAAIDKAGTSSPNQLSKEIGEPLGNVSYHVQLLLKAGVIELASTKPRRGALEHFYSLVADSPILATIRELTA